MRVRGWLVVTSLLFACKRAEHVPTVDAGARQASVEAGPSAVVSASVSAPPSAVVVGPPREPKIWPKLPAREPGMQDHMTVFGWSSDSKWIGGCHAMPSGRSCTFRSTTGAIDEFDEAGAGNVLADPKKSAVVDAKLKAFALVPSGGKWPYDDLVITWFVVEGDQEKLKPGVLKVGVRVGADGPTEWIARLEETSTKYYDRIHPEVVAVSPDGAWLGIVAHAFAGEWANRFPIAIVSTSDVAAKVHAAASAERAGKSGHP